MKEKVVQIATAGAKGITMDKYDSGTEFRLYALTSEGRIFIYCGGGTWEHISLPIEYSVDGDDV